MHFAYPLPWWLSIVLVAAVGALAFLEYRRPLAPLTPLPLNAAAAASGPPVFAVGIGSPDGVRDREVVGLTAGDPRLDQSSVDLHVSAVSSGFGRMPFQLRVLANGRVLETRRLVPPADGSPVDETFTVSPDLLNPTVYTAEIPADESEPVVENNSRSVI